MRGRPQKKIQRVEDPGINKYQFCVGCPHIRPFHAGGNTCPARFNPYEPMSEPDGSPRSDGREGCPKNIDFMVRQKRLSEQRSR